MGKIHVLGSPRELRGYDRAGKSGLKNVNVQFIKSHIDKNNFA